MQALRNIIRLIVCMLLQILLFNRLRGFGLVHPYVYVYFLLSLPLVIPRQVELLIGAAVGLLMDVVCSSPGVHMAACVLLCYLRPVLIDRLSQNSERIAQDISSSTLGRSEFIKLTVLLTLLHHTMVFILDAWSLCTPILLLLRIVLSSLITLVMILSWDMLRH